jgi:hypothetical protein
MAGWAGGGARMTGMRVIGWLSVTRALLAAIFATRVMHRVGPVEEVVRRVEDR